ncbi:hypothetical protein GCM10022243_30950 [Saccharothrix violaceirubra]
MGPGQPAVKVHGANNSGSTGYVDLRNPSSAWTDLSGWSMVSCSGREKNALVTFPAGFRVPPGGRVLVAGGDFAGDGTRQVTVPAVDGEGAALLDRRGVFVDRFALTPDSPCREKEAALPCGHGMAPQRDALSTDTDDNRADFTCAPTVG